MLSIYPAIFYKESDGWSVIFPDLNHLATDGSDFNEAYVMAIDCLAGYLYSEMQDGNEIPTPTPIEKVDIHCEDDEGDTYELALVNAVAVDVENYAKRFFETGVNAEAV